MTLYSIINKLKECASAEPNINTVIEGDIYQLNTNGDVRYSAFCVTPTRMKTSEDIDYYTLTLFYVDRLNESRDNQIELLSRGTTILRNIINRFNSVDDTTQIDYTFEIIPFIQRFASDCSGVMATVIVTTETIGICDI